MSEQIKSTLQGAIAVTRFGLGASEGEILAASQNSIKWLKSQLNFENIKPYPMDGILTCKEYIIEEQVFKKKRKKQTDPELKFDIVKAYNTRNRSLITQEHITRFSYGMHASSPFHERLVRFWSNHFSVSGRNRRNLTAATHEREAIRPKILGSFYDLALSAILHPAMLLYLDNVQSVGPNSMTGLIGVLLKKGLNENLAREVMELHTITPQAKYSQNDVTEFAKALTGWSIGGSSYQKTSQGVTVFDKKSHEPGNRTVLNKTYFPLGEKQAKIIIRNLCEHPETAANIAYKLARHFISDNPPYSLVDRIRRTFIQTNGDLISIYNTLIESPEAWEPYHKKLKTPDELLISTARLIGTENTFPTAARDLYEGFGQHMHAAPTPEGWPDTLEAWLGPDAVTKRIEWANALATRIPHMDARKFLTSALGARASEKTTQMVANAESGPQALVLALMSPEFQRR